MFSADASKQIPGLGLTLVSAIAPTLGIEVPYSVRAIGVGIGVFLTLWPLWVWCWRRFLAKKVSIMEPWHVVAIGLIIAFGGLVWQQLRQPERIEAGASAASPSAIIAVPLDQPTPPTPKRIYSEYEKNQKLPVINEFRDYLEGQLQKIIDEGPRLASGWWNAIKDPKNNPTYDEDLKDFFDILNNSSDLIDDLRKKHHRHEEIYVVTEPTYRYSAVSKMNVFRVNYAVAANAIKPDASQESFYVLMNPARSSFEEGLKEFTSWRNSTLGRLSDLEREMTRQQ